MPPKVKKADTLIEILRRGLDIIMKHGFQAAGLNDILRAAGVPKGSFYYYFKSKEDFGLQVIDFYAGFLFARLEDALDDQSIPPLERLKAFFREFGRDMADDGFAAGSLIGNLTLEMAGQNPVFKEKLGLIYETLTSQIQRCLKEAAVRNEILVGLSGEKTADFIVNAWEGAVLRAKVEGSVEPIVEFEQYIFSILLGWPQSGWVQ